MFTIPTQYNSLKFVRPISWEALFGIWKKGEASQAAWKKHWEERGFASWDEWRSNYVSPLEPEKLEWRLFEIQKPLEDVPNFCGIPSQNWIKNAYRGKKTKQLKDLLGLPLVRDNDKIAAIQKSFPETTVLTGLIYKETIILYEGMHRACALASWNKKAPPKAKIFIALAKWKGKEIPLVGSGHKK